MNLPEDCVWFEAKATADFTQRIIEDVVFYKDYLAASVVERFNITIIGKL